MMQERQIMADAGEVLEFTLGNEHYALDITPVREIVEMTPITVIPRAPEHITGVINLRGEIVNILNLNSFLKLPNQPIYCITEDHCIHGRCSKRQQCRCNCR